MKDFKTWIVEEHRNSNSNVGDLARKISADELFPETKSLGVILKHFKWLDVIDQTIGSTKAAYRLYIKTFSEKSSEQNVNTSLPSEVLERVNKYAEDNNLYLYEALAFLIELGLDYVEK